MFFANHVQHVHDRVTIWLHPFRPDLVNGPRATRSPRALFAQADGGLFGQGLGQSLLQVPGPKGSSSRSCPRRKTDLIYAVITNELGLFGAAAVILIYLLFVRAASRRR